MTLTLTLTLEQERRLQESVGKHDEISLRRILSEALDPVVATLLQDTGNQASEDEFHRLAKRLGSSFSGSADHSPLADGAVSRDGIYGDHL